MNSIFSDKATIIIRTMLSNPSKKWVVRDFVERFNISQGRTATVLKKLREKGFVGGISSGRKAYNVVKDSEGLIKEWIKAYSFEFNEVHKYYSANENLLNYIQNYFKKRKIEDKYALTLHTGANFITSYVNTNSIYCYLCYENFNEISLYMRQSLDLKELKRGGNIFLIKPYYKKSIFLNRQNINGFNIVSNLQLYLDLYNFPQRGREHAEYLMKVIKEKGKDFG